MALFGISRYLGDDESGENSTGQAKAESILEKLHKQAKQRKKERESLGEIESFDRVEETPEIQTELKAGESKSTKGTKRKQKSESESLSPSKKHLSKSADVRKEFVGGNSEKDAPSPKKRRRSKSTTESVVASPAKTKQKEDLSVSATRESSDSSSSSDSQDVGIEDTVADDDEKSKDNIDPPVSEGQSHSEIGGFTVIGDVGRQKKQKVQRVLPDWLANPSVITADIRNKSTPLGESLGLDEDLTKKLAEHGVTHLFPVQAQVIPALLESCRSGHLFGRAGYRPSDICCSAPTGSGKTLAFALPIIQALKKRVVCAVRALVVLPVRDLATQVYRVFQMYCKDTNIKVGLIIGQKTFSSEQQSLVRSGYHGYQSQVDIVVATPGRLVDHINQTEGFSLKQLRFLVIDEADRMMEEIKQDWLTQVERAVYEETGQTLTPTPGCDLPTACLPSGARTRPAPPSVSSASRMEIPLQKLLFSATLSQNPEKLQQLNLFQPKLFTSVVNVSKPVESGVVNEESRNEDAEKPVVKATPGTPVVTGEFVGKYTTPGGLTEYYAQCSVAEKPLVMLYILRHLKFKHILCFTNSVEATHRLYTLVKLVGGVEVREFSSNLHAVKRGRILRQFEAGKIDLLICSDAMARGMDVDNVQCVISYESPPFLKTYIHRVGRTARAGRVGSAITLLEKKEIYHFKKMLKEAGKGGYKEMKIKPLDLQEYIPMYQSALKEMPDVLKAERRKPRR